MTPIKWTILAGIFCAIVFPVLTLAAYVAMIIVAAIGDLFQRRRKWKTPLK